MNFQILKFKRKLIVKYEVVSPMDVVHKSVTRYSEHMIEYIREQEKVVERQLGSLQLAHPEFIVPGIIVQGSHAKKERGGREAFENTISQTDVFKSQIAAYSE